MLHLLTFGVIVFQVAILVTIIGFSLIGRRWLNITTLVWVAWAASAEQETVGLPKLNCRWPTPDSI